MPFREREGDCVGEKGGKREEEYIKIAREMVWKWCWGEDGEGSKSGEKVGRRVRGCLDEGENAEIVGVKVVRS